MDNKDELQDPKHLCNHPSVKLLSEKFTLEKLCGYIALIKRPGPARPDQSKQQEKSSEARDPSEISDLLGPTNDADADRSSLISFRTSLSSTVTKDPRKIKTDKVRLTDDETFDDFLVFDCVFGIPLFDDKLNERICERINSKELLAHEKFVFCWFKGLLTIFDVLREI